jgi:hypothetical protein
MRPSHFTTSFAALTMFIASTAHAQWINDSTMHQVVADGSGEQVQPKIVPTLDGGCYVSWFSSDSGYDVRLQRLDNSGNEMWAHNGILIADRGFSSTQDYGLDVDSNGNAIIAFRDDRFGGVVVTAQSVAPDGSLLWGANGIQLGNSADSINAPDIASTSDGKAVIGWINNTDTHLTQIDAMGTVGWTTVLNDAGGDSINIASLHRSDNGSVIVSWVQFGFFLGPKHLYAQKIAADGSEAWGSRVAVYDAGSLQFGNFPEFVPDGSGGAVFSWYDTANSLNVYIQRLNTNGLNIFTQNGFAASTNPRDRVSPAVAFDFNSDSIYVAWTELDNNQGSQGLYAQHINVSGNRVWSDSGKVLSAIDANETGAVNAQVMDGNFTALWIENTGAFASEQVLAYAVAPDGSNVWSAGSVDVASDSAQRSRLTSTVSTDGFVIAGWQIGDFGVADLQTHNINPDGTLGAAASCPADLTGEGDLNFLDVSAFLAAYGMMDPVADFEPDGSFNFLDVSAYLAAYGMGCP